MGTLIPVFMFTDIKRVVRYLKKRMAARASVKVGFCSLSV
jgi:hypothetical protein